ncbi:MAG: energy-coupling factor transporter ATPase [Promethearchaeota archaeon]
MSLYFFNNRDYNWTSSKLNPVLKLLFLLQFFIILLLFTSPIFYIIPLIFILAICINNSILKKIISYLKFGLYICIFVVVFNVLLNPNGTHYIYSVYIPFFNYTLIITIETIVNSLISSVSLILIIIIFGLINMLIDPDQLSMFFSKIRMPYLLQFIIITAIRFFPLLLSDLSNVIDVQKSRGFELESKNILKNLKNKMMLLLPLLTNSLDRSVQMAESLEARGFGINKKRTVYKSIKFKKIDKAILLVITLLFITIFSSRLFSIGLYSAYPSLKFPALDKLDLLVFLIVLILNILIYIIYFRVKPLKQQKKSSFDPFTNDIASDSNSSTYLSVYISKQNNPSETSSLPIIPSKPIISIKDLSFRYLTRNKPSLRNINLKIKQGEFILIIGKSGSGKTTLIRTINGLIPHFYGGELSGSVIVKDMNPMQIPTRTIAKYVGFVFQNPDNQLFMTKVEKEIAFGLENLAIPENEMEEKVRKIIKILNLENLKNKKISTLSGGEKQKIAIAAALAPDPEILILDEPTAELDPYYAELILKIIFDLNQKLGKTIILIEHRIEKIIPYADRIILMDDGQIIADNTPSEFYLNINRNVSPTNSLYSNDLIEKFTPIHIKILHLFIMHGLNLIHNSSIKENTIIEEDQKLITIKAPYLDLNPKLAYNLISEANPLTIENLAKILNPIFKEIFKFLKQNGKDPKNILKKYLYHNQNLSKKNYSRNYYRTISLLEIENLVFYYSEKNQQYNSNESHIKEFNQKQEPLQDKLQEKQFNIIAKNDCKSDFKLVINKKQFFAGYIVGIIGPNGSGKSTLLKLLNGILKPIKGEIKICGESINNKSVAKISKNVGLMFQNPAIQFFRDTLYDEFHAILYNYVEDLNEIKPRIQTLMKSFELLKFKNEYPRYLSQGELQRASLISTILSSPKILALDEPTHGMDYYQKEYLFDFLRKYANEGNLVLIASHDIDTIANYADRIIFMNKGEIKIDGTPEQVISQLKNTKMRDETLFYFQTQTAKLINYLKIFDHLSDEHDFSIVSSKVFLEFVQKLISEFKASTATLNKNPNRSNNKIENKEN